MAVGRFQVMSILQAARAEALGLPHDSALSWGLNRAIFYAAAKRGFKGALGVGREGERKRKPQRHFTLGTSLLSLELNRRRRERKIFFTSRSGTSSKRQETLRGR